MTDQCPAGLALCGVPCGCQGHNPSHRAVAEQPKCREGCRTQDHATWGECVRAAKIAIDRTALARGRES
jgi:hypothetical protein